MHIGMTGTARGGGMTEDQQLVWLEVLQSLEHPITLHHGDAIGADAQAHDIARPWVDVIEVHPPEIDRYRAHKHGDVEHPKKPYLERNRDIVDASDILYVFPKGYTEELRSGTWATYRYAKGMGCTPVVIVYPDGSMLEEA